MFINKVIHYQKNSSVRFQIFESFTVVIDNEYLTLQFKFKTRYNNYRNY
jgi:hypothetical protein